MMFVKFILFLIAFYLIFLTIIGVTEIVIHVAAHATKKRDYIRFLENKVHWQEEALKRLRFKDYSNNSSEEDYFKK